VISLSGGRLGPGYTYDDTWVEGMEKRAGQMRERLENELNGHKANVNKESIRLVSSSSRRRRRREEIEVAVVLVIVVKGEG